MQTKQFDRHIDSVLASLDVLDCFLTQPKMTIKDFMAVTGMTRNRVSRILGTLIHKGYAMETMDGGLYTAGPKLMALGNVFRDNQNLIVLARTVLRELALRTTESATFYVREGKERVVLAREEGTNPIRFSVAVGQRMDLHAGAAGKVLLAYASDTEREIILSSDQLPGITSHTITKPGELMAELGRIRKEGFAMSKGERNPDAFSIAVPVFERETRIIGAIALAGPISRCIDENVHRYLEVLRSAAEKLSDGFCRVGSQDNKA